MGDPPHGVGTAPRPAVRPDEPPRVDTTPPGEPPARVEPAPADGRMEPRVRAPGEPEPAEIAPRPGAPGTNLVVPGLSELPPERAASARIMVNGILDRTAALTARGLDVDPNGAATGPHARTTRELGVRELTALVHDVAPDRVSDAQIAALRARNPRLTGDRVASGTDVDIAATPVGLELAQRHLRLTQNILAARQAAGEDIGDMGTAVDRRLAQVTTARHQLDLGRTIAATDDNLLRVPPDRRAAAIAPMYEVVRQSVIARERRGELGADDARGLRTQLAAAEAQMLARTMLDGADRFVTDARERRELERPGIGTSPMGQLVLMQQNERWRRDNHGPAVARIEAGRDAAIRRLEELRAAAPENAGELDTQIARLRDEARQATARVHVAAGDPLAAERLFLPEALTRDGSVSEPTSRMGVDTSGRPQTFWGALTGTTTQIGVLSEERRNALLARIESLPPEERQQATRGLLQLADVYAATDDVNRLSTTRQLLLGASERLADPALRIRTGFVDARYATRIGNFEGARTALERSMQDAGSLSGDDRVALQREAAAGLVAVHRSEAFGGTDEATRNAAAMRLRELRVRMEQDGSPLTRDQQARLALLEAQTFLERHDPGRSIETLRTLDRYTDLPWAAAAASAFRADHTEAGITAAIKVGLRYANSSGTGLTIGSTVGGGVIGAGIGFTVGGPVGAGVGFLLGSAVGGVGAAGYSVASNWDRVSAAFNTGMTSLSAGDALVDGAFAALNLSSVVPPIAGASRVMSLARGPALMQRLTAELGPEATREMLAAHAGRILQQEFATAAGRTALPLGVAGTGLIATQLGAEYVRIESMPAGPARDDARRRFGSALAESGLIMAATIGSSMTVSRLAASANRRWPVSPLAGAVETPPRLGVELAPSVFDTLQSRAIPFRNIDDIPGGAGGARAGTATHYLRTTDIQPGDLPYTSELRPVRPPGPLPGSIEEMPRAPVARVTNTVMASDDHSGSAGFVRLAVLEDGRPVVIKSYHTTNPNETVEVNNRFALLEAQSLQRQDELGIGPRFHGVVRDGDRWGVVMDIVPGDFVGTPVNQRTLQDAESIISRLRNGGYEDLGDFQMYRTQQGRLLSIDAGFFADAQGRSAITPPNARGGAYTSIRLPLVAEADPSVGIPYLESLRQGNPEAFVGLIEQMNSYNHRNDPWAVRMRERYGDYVRQHLPTEYR